MIHSSFDEFNIIFGRFSFVYISFVNDLRPAYGRDYEFFDYSEWNISLTYFLFPYDKRTIIIIESNNTILKSKFFL